MSLKLYNAYLKSQIYSCQDKGLRESPPHLAIRKASLISWKEVKKKKKSREILSNYTMPHNKFFHSWNWFTGSGDPWMVASKIFKPLIPARVLHASNIEKCWFKWIVKEDLPSRSEWVFFLYLFLSHRSWTNKWAPNTDDTQQFQPFFQ